MRRFLTWKVGAAALLAGLLLAGWAFFYEPIRVHRKWSDAVRADIQSLAHKRPPNVTRGQWEYAVGWTINLHANCSFDPWDGAREWRVKFEAELKHRLQGRVTLADIEWIWDEYAAHTQNGQKYSDKYRPTRDPDFHRAEPGCFNMPVE